MKKITLITIVLSLCCSLNGCATRDHYQGEAQGDFDQQVFQTPEELVGAVKVAVNTQDSEALLRILGPKGRDLVFSGDPVSDRLEMDFLAQRLNERAELVPHRSSDFPNVSVMKLRVGKMGMNAGLPLVNEGKGWRLATYYFAPRSVKRRIASNEIQVWRACAEYAEAQKQYIQRDRDGDNQLEYAQQLLSSPGKHDGLYWATSPGEAQSPLGEVIAAASAKGYQRSASGAPTPYHGYIFKVLKAQGKSARSGTRQYMNGENMVNGYAMIAYPAEWSVSGLRTYIVGPEGLIYGKNLGFSTESLATEMTEYNPDNSWSWVQQPQIKDYEQYLERL